MNAHIKTGCYHLEFSMCFTEKRRENIEMLENFIFETIGASIYHVIVFVVSYSYVYWNLEPPLGIDTIETTIANNSN